MNIGILGLSLAIDLDRKEKMHTAIKHLQELGHNVLVGDTCFSKFGFKTASIEERVSELESMFLNSKIDIILNTCGGYSSNEMLEFINYDIIKRHPKKFVGYSDITAINLGLYHKANIPTINGPMLGSFESDPNCFVRFFEQISLESYVYRNWETTYSGRTKEDITTGPIRMLPNKKEATDGKAVAGNQSTFNLLIGTPYLPDLTDSILFIEYDIVEIRGLPTLERFLWQARHAGVFDKISALVLGRLEPRVEREQTEYNVTLESILEEVTQGFLFPVLYNAQFGHIHPSWIIENGMSITIDGTNIVAQRKEE